MNIQKLRARSEIVKLIRRFFDEKGFSEVHTPRLVGVAGQEPYLEPFKTSVTTSTLPSYNPTVLPAYLITSPEYSMKRLLAAGMDRIYDLGPCFRNNEPWDGSHDPEFLMLEWYQKGMTLNELMDQTEELIRFVSEKFRVAPESLARSWRRMTVEEAFREYVGVELVPMFDDVGAMAETARGLGLSVSGEETWDDLFFKIFLTHIEPKLSAEQPTFLYRYPVSMAALAKPCKDDPRFAERVELYAGGLELANGFEELTDADEQRRRFREEQALRTKLGKETWPIDERFLQALPSMGEAAGISLGVDRLVMLFTDSSSINDVIPFPARERFGN